MLCSLVPPSEESDSTSPGWCFLRHLPHRTPAGTEPYERVWKDLQSLPKGTCSQCSCQIPYRARTTVPSSCILQMGVCPARSQAGLHRPLGHPGVIQLSGADFFRDPLVGEGLELSSCGTVALLWVRSQDTTKSSTAWTSSRADHTGWRQAAMIIVPRSLRGHHSSSSLQLA